MNDGPYEVHHDEDRQCYFVCENGKKTYHYYYTDQSSQFKAGFDAQELATMLNVAYLTGYIDGMQERD